MDILATHLAASHTLTLRAAPLHLVMNILAQTGAPVALHNIG
jgi:hypothetical protein